MSKKISLKKGFDISLKGKPEERYLDNFKSNTFSVKPTDFEGIRPIPKMTVEVGDEVLAGDQLFFDKPNPEIVYAAPVSGEVVEIKRGAKRSIIEVVILSDGNVKFKPLDKINISSASAEEIKTAMLASGIWPFIKQRPYNVIADPAITPRDIFISCVDTNPLAPNLEFTMKNQLEDFQNGLLALKKLTTGNVHLGTKDAGSIFSKFKNEAKINSFSGPHPSGNVGVQIHHIAPINKGETVWTLHPYDVAALGRVLKLGAFNTKRGISVAGPAIEHSAYIDTYAGANIENALKENTTMDHIRVVSGSVLSGENIGKTGHLGVFDYSLAALEEGDFHEMFGWLLPSYARPSLSKTIPPLNFSTKFPFIHKVSEFEANTNTHGEKRAFVVSGQYEKVVPMDIYPQHLLKAILSGDLDLMEGLGIYEVVEEDLALCEFVCTSKFAVQKTLRDGMNILIEQS